MYGGAPVHKSPKSLSGRNLCPRLLINVNHDILNHDIVDHDIVDYDIVQVNSDQHFYIETLEDGEREIEFLVETSKSSDYKWGLWITQIFCDGTRTIQADQQDKDDGGGDDD